MKILDDWKVYGGVSDLKQHAEGIPVSQVIINSNYSDDHDDYDIALMKLSRPLMLSGQGSHLAMPQGWAWQGLVFGGQREAAGDGQEQETAQVPLEPSPGLHGAAASWSIPLCCGHTAFPCLARGQEPARPPPAGPDTHAAVGSAAQPALCRSPCPTWAVRRGGAGRDPAWVGAEGSASCTPRSSLAAGLVTTMAILLLGDSSLSPPLVFIMSPSSSGSPSLPPYVRPAIPDRQVLLHHRLWENQGERR